MNPFRILGAAANLFFLVFFTIYLAGDSSETGVFSTPIVIGGAVVLYGIALSVLFICFGLDSAYLKRNGLYGSVVSMIFFSGCSLLKLLPQAQQGMMLMSVWSTVNVLALGFGDDEEQISLKEQRRLAEQKRKLDRLRGKNPNETDKTAD